MPARQNFQSRLWDWLEDIPPNNSGMIWCHTTDAFRFRNIVESGVCKIRLCEVFKEDLLYLFYGRPAFRVEDENMGKAGVSPVVLLFDEKLIAAGKRLYPFDTGAFSREYYRQWMHPEMILSDFELACIQDAPRKFIAAFFGTNLNYFKTLAQAGDKPYAGDFEVKAMYDLFREHGTFTPKGGSGDSSSTQKSKKIDDRRIAIELQLDSDVRFDQRTLRAVIYPDELVSVKWLTDFKQNHPDTKFREYITAFDKQASEYQALLEDRAFSIQRELGFV